ncbi:ABC transporter substrate-binding protein [Arachnia rubra]|jgi:hypothetical protein|uniref:ABC transporter substrate-binding protein n=1 Tax=Arachnia rubra TaxID=1547448 RepID=A0ABX7Y4V5_9ACTN|nr:ABC transporter substrate-binding protein [Arachnia rubra]MBB1571863.1 ABC transporter substrate-binding protein [Propionibacterium sp.]MDO4646484.1 ABC transporter substrate-binding protein [Propionibacteriaceae bacterium]QUC08230.1 ABC transporter substrate-binding protein [Arachnia rubra]BCR79591.1 ABC transporter substrate-binding protein [Arachnia rubra]
MLRRFLGFLIAGLLVVVSGCGTPAPDAESPAPSVAPSASASPAISLSSESFPLTVTDTTGRQVSLERRPERVVFLSGTPLNVWYDAGGSAVGRPELTDNIRLGADYAGTIMALPSVGMPYATDSEAVAGLQPDLVVGVEGPHDAAVEAYQKLGINSILVKIRSLDDLRQTYQAFGTLAGSPETARQRIAAIDAQCQQVLSQVPGRKASVVILFVTAQSLAVKRDNSIAGQMSLQLGLTNIASGSTPDNPGSETTPLDIEYIVSKQPDHVLVTSMMGSNEQARETLQAQLETNPAWQTIDAVREGRIHYLPQQYFLFNAGPYYGDALAYLAATIHPDVFGAPVEP